MYDYIIIGGGVAGLYMNYLLNDKYKTLLLEKNNYFGGRVLEGCFHHKKVPMGAKVGATFNKHLMRLLKRINISYKPLNEKTTIISKDPVDMRHMVHMIVNKYNILKNINLNNINLKTMSAKDFIIKYFGEDFFHIYCKFAEYTDFFHESIGNYIKYYPIKDHIPVISNKNIVKINWTKMVLRLYNIIKKKNKLIRNYTVKKITKKDSYYIIDNKYKTKNIIFAVTINALLKIATNNNIFKTTNYKKYIGSVPFIRIYTWHKNGHKLNIDPYNIVDSRLHKIMKITDKILTIMEVDNMNAKYWKKFIGNKKLLIKHIKNEIKKILSKDIADKFTIDDMLISSWLDAVHYIKPSKYTSLQIIKKLMTPAPNIYVCGEMISLKQGWVEGAVESVDRLFKILPK